MIERIWYARATPENADEYAHLLEHEIVPEFEANVDGLTGFRLGRRETTDEMVELVTTMTFEDWDAVETFAGEDYEAAHVPEIARDVLADWEPTVRHYEYEEFL
ncbi:antibiotic biosynthesis monooxygenase [Halarchaeum sp. CBA1220]|uniref:antibiotic biosynthesis monooxygenase n=1 Tax=Halarchaeum sp. CBA1220 TaxID=1853682 RepID=UPI000F3A98C5|nr:antibiotic biosynthesis monooxygenase [Halarchaeum sp. CBA1220]QLC32776.1 antibiotic biosynthesis monooxygenase [Halarchaeum sp. CBA1220]